MTTIIRSPEWRNGTRPSRAAIRRQPAPGVELHHSVTGRAASRERLIAIARAIYKDHTDKDWADVFYGWLIGDDSILEVRGYDRLSGSVPHMTVCLIGNYRDDVPNDFQLGAIAWLRILCINRGGGRDLVWHMMRDNSECPGRHGIIAAEHMLRTPWPGVAPHKLNAHPLFSGGAPATPPPSPPPVPGPRPGDTPVPRTIDLRPGTVRGSAVPQLQGLLLAAGYGPEGLVGRDGRPDGIAGPLTRGAVAAFQRAHPDLDVDYIVGPLTWRALILR